MGVAKYREQDLVNDCITLLDTHGVYCWRQNQGAVKKGKWFFRMTSRDGISDILGVLPPGGKLLAIECKLPGNKPTPKQLAFQSCVAACGGVAVVVHSVAEMESFLKEWGF